MKGFIKKFLIKCWYKLVKHWPNIQLFALASAFAITILDGKWWSALMRFDDFLEDYGLCFYAFEEPLTAYSPSFELFMYTLNHLWLNFFRMHDMLEFPFQLLTNKQQMYAHYLYIIDRQIITLLGLYERLLDTKLIEKMPLDQRFVSIPKTTYDVLNELNLLIKLRMEIYYIHCNLKYELNLNLNPTPEDLLFKRYVSQWDLVQNCFSIFFKENIKWSDVPPDLKLELSRWESRAYYDDKYFAKFINSQSFDKQLDKYRFLRRIPHDIPDGPWSIVCSRRFLEVKAEWDLIWEKIRNN